MDLGFGTLLMQNFFLSYRIDIGLWWTLDLIG